MLIIFCASKAKSMSHARIKAKRLEPGPKSPARLTTTTAISGGMFNLFYYRNFEYNQRITLYQRITNLQYKFRLVEIIGIARTLRVLPQILSGFKLKASLASGA